MAELLSLIHESGVATALRGSRWAYPFVNGAHILGIALLIGAVLPLDLRLLGVWRGVTLSDLQRVLIPVALSGLALAIVTGALLFSVSPAKYANLPLFQFKLALVLVSILNIVFIRGPLAGVTSIVLWITILFCGRMIAYVV